MIKTKPEHFGHWYNTHVLCNIGTCAIKHVSWHKSHKRTTNNHTREPTNLIGNGVFVERVELRDYVSDQLLAFIPEYPLWHHIKSISQRALPVWQRRECLLHFHCFVHTRDRRGWCFFVMHLAGLKSRRRRCHIAGRLLLKCGVTFCFVRGSSSSSLFVLSVCIICLWWLKWEKLLKQ